MLNQEKIGRFIADRRKMCGVTQKQLAEKLGVSDKAVSKWETGRSMPDNSILMELCEELGINVNELLSGEKLSDDSYHGKAEENMVNLIKQTENEKRKAINSLIGGITGIIALIVVLIGSIYLVSGDFAWYIDLPSLIIIMLITIIVLLASGLCKDFIVSFAVCTVNKTFSAEQYIKAVAAHKLVLITLPLAGIITAAFSVISVLVNSVNVHGQGIIGLNFAVAMLPVLYGFVLDLIILPFSARLWALGERQ